MRGLVVGAVMAALCATCAAAQGESSEDACQALFKGYPAEVAKCQNAVLPAIPPKVPATEETQSEWASRVLQTNGWTYLGDGPGLIVYVKRGPNAKLPTHRMTWVRFEYQGPQTAMGTVYRSTVSLYEADCGTTKMQVKQITAFEQNNSREPLQLPFTVGVWDYPIPNSFGEIVTKTACEAARRTAPSAPSGALPRRHTAPV